MDVLDVVPLLDVYAGYGLGGVSLVLRWWYCTVSVMLRWLRAKLNGTNEGILLILYSRNIFQRFILSLQTCCSD